MENLENIIESILFVAGDSVAFFDIAEKLELDIKKVKKAIFSLKQKREEEKSGIQIIVFNDKAQLCSNKIYVEEVKKVLNPIKEKMLSKAVLEACAIIAYKQPITRTEIENVRQKDSDYAINVLIENNLIEVIGRKDALGKPLLFGTTDNFLKKFGLSSLNELPDYDELLNRIKIIYEDRNPNLFNFSEISQEETDINSDVISPDMEKKLLNEINSLNNSVYNLDKNDDLFDKITTNLANLEDVLDVGIDSFFDSADNKF